MDGRIRFLRAICWSHPSVSPAPAPCPDGGGHVALPADLQKTRHKQCKLQCTFPRCLHPGTNMHRDLILSLGITSLHGQAFSTVRPIIKCAVTRMRRYLNRAVCLSSCVWHSGGDYCTAFRAALLRRIAHLMLRTQGTPTIPTRSSSIRNNKKWKQDKTGYKWFPYDFF